MIDKALKRALSRKIGRKLADRIDPLEQRARVARQLAIARIALGGSAIAKARIVWGSHFHRNVALRFAKPHPVTLGRALAEPPQGFQVPAVTFS